MPHIDAQVVGQGKELARRIIRILGAATGKVAPARSHIGQKDGVAHKGGIAHNIGCVCRGMPRGVDYLGGHVGNGEFFVIIKQVVKGRAVCRGVLLRLKNGCPGGDDVQHVFADGDFSAHFFLEIAGGSDVVGMDVCFKNPFNHQILLAHKGNNGICRSRGRAAGVQVEIEHAVYDGATALGVCCRPDHICPGGGNGIKKTAHVGCRHGELLCKMLG